jgi:hypothetical protein
VGFAVLLIDHRRVVLADQLVLVRLLDGIQRGQRGVESLLRGGVEHQLLLVSHGTSLVTQ